MKILGILNVTPDSFSDGSREAECAIEHGLHMHADGADIIDVGGESTRPGFAPVDMATEIARVVPVIRGLVSRVPGVSVSIDTRKPKVAEQALAEGATILNAYQGLDDPDMAAVAKRHRCSVIAYHTAEVRHASDADALIAVREFFERQEARADAIGLRPEQLICDPGIGFGKSLSQNIMLLRELRYLAGSSRQMLIGISRKSHLGILLRRQLGLPETPGTQERLEAGLAETAFAVQNGAAYVRTHDVRATRRFLAIWIYLTEGQ